MQHMWNIFAVYVNQKLVKNIFDFFASKIPKIFWQPMWNILCHFSVTYVLAAYVDSLCNRSLCRCSLCGNFIILHICKKSLTSMWIFDHLCKNSLCRATYVVAAYVTKNEYWWTPNASVAKNQIKMAQQAKWPIVQKLVIAAWKMQHELSRT